MHAVAPLIDESSGESPLTVEYPGNGIVRFNAAIRVAIKRYNHAVTWATRHFISLISISKKYESNFKEISKLHLLVVIYECTSGQRKHRHSKKLFKPQSNLDHHKYFYTQRVVEPWTNYRRRWCVPTLSKFRTKYIESRLSR